jgi:hypothetical protein
MDFADGFQIQGLKRSVSSAVLSTANERSCDSLPQLRSSLLTGISTNGETTAYTHSNSAAATSPIDFQFDWVALDIVTFTEYLENEVLNFSKSTFDPKDLGKQVLLLFFASC